MDEKYVQVKKGNGYDLNAIDHKTKYVLSHSFVKNRTKEEVIGFLRKIKITCYEQILEVYLNEKHKKSKDRELIIFVSDGFENYKNAFNRLLPKPETHNLQLHKPAHATQRKNTRRRSKHQPKIRKTKTTQPNQTTSQTPNDDNLTVSAVRNLNKPLKQREEAW